MKTIPLDKLCLDGDTQPRTAIDQSVVNDYAALYEAGVKLPPVDVFFDGTIHWLADGFHRWHGARKADLDKIPCNVHQGTQEDAQWFAVQANKAHGLRRSPADKEKAIKAALRHPKGAKMSDRQLAKYVGVSDKTVAKFRAQLERRSEIPHVDTRTDTAGREQPARKPREAVESGEVEPCPDCGGTDFHPDSTCASCYAAGETTFDDEETEVKPTEPGDHIEM
jgi:ParB-like chromosome segregation protein Spo0J